jgi:hypothetical protein
MRFLFQTGLLLLAALLPLSASASNWPQFRGPQASGLDASAPAPVHWEIRTGENVRWSTPIPGLAHSSPILWGDRVYVTTATGPGKADLKVGLYGNIESANDQDTHEWHLLSLDEGNGKVLMRQADRFLRALRLWPLGENIRAE